MLKLSICIFLLILSFTRGDSYVTLDTCDMTLNSPYLSREPVVLEVSVSHWQSTPHLANTNLESLSITISRYQGCNCVAIVFSKEDYRGTYITLDLHDRDESTTRNEFPRYSSDPIRILPFVGRSIFIQCGGLSKFEGNLEDDRSLSQSFKGLERKKHIKCRKARELDCSEDLTNKTYNPVCVLNQKIPKTFETVCLACNNPSINEYIEEPCEPIIGSCKKDVPIDLDVDIPVCGFSTDCPDNICMKTYPNVWSACQNPLVPTFQIGEMSRY